MKQKEELYLILGCFGRRDDDFINCLGVENKILKLDPSLYKYTEMMTYLDGCRLFDRPMFDYNAVRHVIFNLREKYDQPTKRLWSEKKFELYQKFTIDHRHCGIYLKLALVLFDEENQPVIQPEKPILISGEEEKKTEFKPHNLKLVRGRLR